MFAAIVDFATEVPRLLAGLDGSSAGRYLGAALTSLPAILKDRTLRAADLKMGGEVHYRYRGATIHIPVRPIDAALARFNDSPTFTGVREMYANDCYLWPFRDFKAETVVDLGANRSFFAPIAFKALEAKRYAGVEPLAQYDEATRLLLDANGISAAQATTFRKYASSKDCDSEISVLGLMSAIGATHIDLLKVDIEGAEYPLFSDAPWLSRVTTIVLEVHPPGDAKARLATVLESAGFALRCTDSRRNSVTASAADYFFGTRQPELFR
ncbi:MAG: FkbM family methyltransferase [Devosia sp.]